MSGHACHGMLVWRACYVRACIVQAYHVDMHSQEDDLCFEILVAQVGAGLWGEKGWVGKEGMHAVHAWSAWCARGAWFAGCGVWCAGCLELLILG